MSAEPGSSLLRNEELVHIVKDLIWLQHYIFFVYIQNVSFTFCGGFVCYQLFLVIVCTDEDFEYVHMKC